MKIEDIKLSQVKYKFANFEVSVGGTDKIVVPKNMISNVVMEKDYDNYIFPFFQIEITLPTWFYAKMAKNPTDIRVTMNWQYGKFSANDLSAAPPFVSELNGQYYALMVNSNPDVYESKTESREKEAQSLNTAYSYGDQVTTVLALYNTLYYMNVNNVVNEILSSANLTDVMTYVLNKARLSYVLMSPPNNRKSYSEFRITPLKAINQILRLCNDYAFYTTGAVIFFDLDMGYILDKTPTCTAWRPNEYKTTHLMTLPARTQSATVTGGCYTNSAEKYNMINIAPDVQLLNQAMINKMKSFVVVDEKTGEIKTVNTGAVGSSSMSNSPAASFIFKLGEDLSSALGTLVKQSERQVICNMSYCQLGMLAPNKEYILTIDDGKLAKLNGKYRISKYTCLFQADAGYWSPSITGLFMG